MYSYQLLQLGHPKTLTTLDKIVGGILYCPLEPFALPKWRKSPEFREFVVSFGRLLPLEKPSPLADKAVIQKLMAFSAGLTGKVTTLLAQAAELAIRQKTERISPDLIEQAAANGTYKYLPQDSEAEVN